MDELGEHAVYHVERLGGPEGEDAYHWLVEADDAVVPFLIEAFGSDKDVDVRATLVEIIWQHRLQETVGFLAQALEDAAPEVWKSALDGLVTLGGQAAVDILESAKQRTQSNEQAEWIDEALQQLREQPPR